MADERLDRAPKSEMAHSVGSDGQREHANSGRGGKQCGGLGGLGMWGRTAEQAARRIAGFRQQSGSSLNVNYPIWPDPRCASETSAAMRHHLQAQYDAHGLG